MRKVKSPAMPALLLSIVLVVVAVSTVSEGAVYKVGDSVGWTILNSPNYTAWELSKIFVLGDIIVFEYNKQFHDVLQVSKEAYKACNASAPVATFSSGNDSIVIKSKGHHYYICGFAGHCQNGQKVDIRIAKQEELSSAAPSGAPTPLPQSTSQTVLPPSPAANGANTFTVMHNHVFVFALAVLSFVVI